MESSGQMPMQYDTRMPAYQDPTSVQYQPASPMGLNFSAFREPRGVMRILQFIFSICAFASTTGFVNTVTYSLSCTSPKKEVLEFSYPFRLDHVTKTIDCQNQISGGNMTTTQYDLHLVGDFSSDAEFFVATGVLAFLYCIGIIVIYVLYDTAYQKNELLPMIDFIVTVILAIFWLSGSAAWANALVGMKRTTNSLTTVKPCTPSIGICDKINVGGFSGLDISVILGFLNFFLWASDLWFLYKETSWFKIRQGSSGMGPA